MNDPSITEWIHELKAGNEEAANAVWQRFFLRVSQLARARFGNAPRRVKDEDDVALSAIHAICRGARDGRFRKLETREDLWQLLALITCRKVANVRRAQGRRPEVGESALWSDRLESGAGLGLDQLIDSRPTEQLVDDLSLTSDELLGKLEPKLKRTALLKLEGYTNAEIAAQMERSEKTIERYLKMIRAQWMNE